MKDRKKIMEQMINSMLKTFECISELLTPAFSEIVKIFDRLKRIIIETGNDMLKVDLIITHNEKEVFWFYLKESIGLSEDEYVLKLLYNRLVDKGECRAKKIYTTILSKKLTLLDKETSNGSGNTK